MEENLDLFERMKNGEFEEGSRVLRAKIDMAAPNVLLRDPTMYRINRTCATIEPATQWCIYPMYDFQHPVQDAIEGVTHSLCSLEYEIHRPLYDWFVRAGKGDRSAAAPDRVRPPEHRAHRHVQALSAPSGGGKAWSAAGTIPACPRWWPCAAEAIPPPPFTTS